MLLVRDELQPTGFYMLPNEIANDRRLSWEARGMLAHLLSKPPGWQVRLTALINETSGSRRASGKTVVADVLKELQEIGYITKSQARDGGRFGENTYIIRNYSASHPTRQNQPETGFPLTVKPTTVFPLTENQPLSNTENYSKTSPTKTETTSADAEKKPGKAKRYADAPAETPRETWLTPYAEIYAQHVGTPPYGQLAKFLAEPHVNDPAALLDAWKLWCSMPEIRAYGKGTVAWFGANWRAVEGEWKRLDPLGWACVANARTTPDADGLYTVPSF